jgi:iron-sulfur cluster assembly transcription factor IscR
MELNTKGRYAVMAMVDLAKHGEAGAVPLSAISERQRISLAYLEQLFLKLRKAGLVESARGRSGGYVLGRASASIRLSEILLAVQEPVRMTRCEDGHVGCVGNVRCMTHDLWRALGDHIASFLDEVSLADVLNGLPGRTRRASADDWSSKFGLVAE